MRKYEFLVSVDFRNEGRIVATGSRVQVKTEYDGTEVFAKLGALGVKILSFKNGVLTVYVPAGGVLPLYYSKNGSRLNVSNFPHLLIGKGDTIQLSGEVLANRLTSAGQQLYDPFLSIPKFEEASVYEITEKRVRLIKGLIGYVENSRFEDTADFLLQRFKLFREQYRSVLIPLSGGYDSRLNLAIASKFFNSDDITCLHEFKNRDEEQIAESVARFSGVTLRRAQRSKDEGEISALSISDDFILLAGLNRRNVLRWTLELNQHQANKEGECIIGFGAEAHKGKFYNQIDNLSSDSRAIFGFKSSLLAAAASELSISKPEPVHERYLASSIEAAKSVFPDMSGQIDYVHYRSYVAASYGYRCRYFSDAHDIDFPYLDAKFLSLVFSMPRDQKENFNLVKQLMAQISPSLNELPYISGNMKSTKGRTSTLNKVIKRLELMINGRPIKGSLKGLSLRTESPQSELTSTLHRLAMSESSFVRNNEAAMMFNYFSLLEELYDVKYELI